MPQYRLSFCRKDWLLAAGLVFCVAFVFVPSIAHAECKQTGDGVWLFSKLDCEGESFPTQTSAKGLLTNMEELGQWNNKTDSIQVVGSHTVFFYEDANYLGKSFCTNEATKYNLDELNIQEGLSLNVLTFENDWQDDIGSIEVDPPDKQCTSPKKTLQDPNSSCTLGDVPCLIRNLTNRVANVGATILDFFVKRFADLLGTLTNELRLALTKGIDSFMSIPVSPSNTGSPEFVRNAWTTVRTLTNNFFILILAFIGLATILRLEAYQLKKTLPALLLVALLVNFSGVLVGLVVDVGNIITSNFLHLAGKVQWEQTREPNWGSGAKDLGMSIVRIFYYIISSFIYLGVLLAFALRTMILWTLAIVSPLAFAAYILPATRRFFNDWWKQLIQWSLFGIPLSFFLYLASLTLKPDAVPGTVSVGALTGFFAPFTTLFLLFTGITMSMAMAPAGAQGIIGGVNKFGRGMPKRIANTGIGRKVRERLAVGTQKVLGLGEGVDERLARLPGPLGVATRPLGWAMRAPSRVWGGELLKVAARTREYEIPKEFDDMSSAEQAAYLKGKGNIGERAKLWARMIKNDTIKYEPDAEAQAEKDAKTLQGDQYYRKEVGTWMDYIPSDISYKLKVQFAGPTTEDQDQMKQKIDKSIKELKAKVLPEDIEIEAGLKLKDKDGKSYITRTEVDADRNTALAKARTKFKPQQLDDFINDTAAAIVHGAELKPTDFARMRSRSVQSLPMRIALQKQTLGTFQAIHQNFEADIENEIFNGIGGINRMVNTREGTEKFFKENEALFRAFKTTPAGRALPFTEGNQMYDPNDNPTTNYAAFEQRMRIQEHLSKAPPILQRFNELHNEARSLQQRIEDLRRRGRATATQEARLDLRAQEIARLYEKIQLDTSLRTEWERIEGLRVRGRRRGGP